MDKIISFLINKEYERQNNELEMIASENYVSKQVLQAYSNVFTNKYSEGYPGNRYYGGQEYVDRLELLTQFRALAVFDLLDLKKLKELEQIILDEKYSVGKLVAIYEEITHKIGRGVNVQPLSGSPANLAVYVGLLNSGDTILGMDLSAGGHLSHGYKITASGKFFNSISYGVKKNTLLIDYDEILEKALKFGPKLIIAGYSAYTRDLDYKRFFEIAKQVEKKYGYRPYLMADISHIAGLIAGGVLSNDLWKYFDIVTTTTHKTLRGPRGALIYYKKYLEKEINRGVFPGIQGGPHQHIILAKAVAFGEILENDKKNWKIYANQVVKNSKVLAEILIKNGWIVLTGGTENHIVLVDVANSFLNLNLDGKIAEKTLEKIGISINKNAIPFDINPPMRPSGIRLGTGAITTRGLKEKDVEIVANIIDIALKNWRNHETLKQLKEKVKDICIKYPLKY